MNPDIIFSHTDKLLEKDENLYQKSATPIIDDDDEDWDWDDDDDDDDY